MVASRFRKVDQKPRVFIISDISNEPDDAESLVRYLLYSNEFDTRGLAACTSNWLRRTVHPEDMEKIIRAYARVVDNLNAHVHPDNQYQPASHFLDILRTGPVCFGKEALADNAPLSDGATLLLERLDESDQPLWILCWGGTNMLAQALHHARKTRSAGEVTELASKVRVYAISDQDDTGAWIRAQFPNIFYIVSIHGWCQYGLATWSGISGELMYKFDAGGPDSTKIGKDWIREHIQIGPLGSAYPDPMFIPEGDTPTFLYLIQNGLGSSEHPEWGSWGGRYTPVDVSMPGGLYSDTADKVAGVDGKEHLSNQATIWRWRDAYQNDFAARMLWSLSSDVTKSDHPPVAIVNGSSGGAEHVYIEAEVDSELTLDASGSYDADGGTVSFIWMHYTDVTAMQCLENNGIPDIAIEPVQQDSSVVRLKLPSADKTCVEMFSGKAQAKGQIHHIVLAVKGSGEHGLVSYKRVVIQITNKELKGARAAVESSMQAHELYT